MRGYVQNIGFKRKNIEYEARSRVAGESKYSIKKLITFSVNTIMCFSNLPLKLGIYAGAIAGILGLAVMIYTIWSWAQVGTPNYSAYLFYVCCFIPHCGNHRKLHCDSVCGAEGSAYLYCGRNKKF